MSQSSHLQSTQQEGRIHVHDHVCWMNHGSFTSKLARSHLSSCLTTAPAHIDGYYYSSRQGTSMPRQNPDLQSLQWFANQLVQQWFSKQLVQQKPPHKGVIFLSFLASSANGSWHSSCLADMVSSVSQCLVVVKQVYQSYCTTKE